MVQNLSLLQRQAGRNAPRVLAFFFGAGIVDRTRRGGLLSMAAPQNAVDARLVTSAVGPEPDMRMRGTDRPQSGMFITYRRIAEYPRSIRCVRFARWLSWCCAIWARSLKRCMRKSGGRRFRPSSCCGRCRLQVLYTVRSERMLMEQLDYNLLFRWFVGLNIDDPIWDATVFTKNRDRLLRAEVAKPLLAEVLARRPAAAACFRLSTSPSTVR